MFEGKIKFQTPYEASMKQTFKYKKKEKQRRKENHERLEHPNQRNQNIN